MPLVFSFIPLVARGGPCTTQISSCQTIKTPGNYCLAADLVPQQPNQTCLYIHDAPGVRLDCQNHTIQADASAGQIPAIWIDNSPAFTLQNCTVNLAHPGGTAPVQISNSGSGPTGNFSYIQRLTVLGGGLMVNNSGGLTIAYNSFSNGVNILGGSQYSIIFNNITIAPDSQTLAPGGVYFGQPTKESIIWGNRIDGGWNGQPQWKGTDGGVIIQGFSDGWIGYNQIKNVLGCGTESVGLLERSTIIGNTYSGNIGTGALCGWYWSSLKNNEIAFNRLAADPTALSAAPPLLNYRWTSSAYIPSPDPTAAKSQIFWSNNNIHDNVATRNGAYTYDLYVDLSMAPPQSLTAVNNRMANNNLGRPSTGFNFGVLTPAKAFVDGGGNVCQLIWMQPDYPLFCNP